MTFHDFDRHPTRKRHKYGAQATTVNGVRYDSKREAKRHAELKIMERAGLIEELETQVSFTLQGPKGPLKTERGQPMKYVADFRYFDVETQSWVYEDTKGMITDVFKIKRAILANMGYMIKIT